MSSNSGNKNQTSGGVGFCGLLTIVFITLKLTEAINWSWVWVFAPMWIPVVIGIFLIIIALLK